MAHRPKEPWQFGQAHNRKPQKTPMRTIRQRRRRRKEREAMNLLTSDYTIYKRGLR